ncbi:precorrin-8X methylmutase [Curvivirga aplysinae]|uniref:precorrin-8X methylmutase n=1 Tax=Curvivirga aplysinae TaxID=2529852 RepID=UPI0012BBC0EF|nr:precorrin-8X methylmutase [Curvivirga aplysinae]MTI10893.1 precorrin-8X methylmutase [Curvivirga aplysinae]
MFDYIRDPMAIYAASFKAIREETDLTNIPTSLHAITLRVVHAAGNPDVVENIAWGGDIAKATDALKQGAPILCDAEMVSHGIIRRRLPAENDVICTLNMDSTPNLAKQIGNTRSAAAVELWEPWLEGAVVAIGNAPTTLFYLLEKIAAGGPKPAAILGFPVGFIGAAESKEALITHAGDIPFVTLRGRLGGSAMAAAAVNALCAENEE